MSERTKAVRAYGQALVATLEAQLPKSLRKLDALQAVKFAHSLTAPQLESFVRSVIRVHADHVHDLLGMANANAPDELVVLDSSCGSIHEPSLSKLMLYAEVLICPDPLLEHPMALRQLVPDHFLGQWPYTLEQLQEQLLPLLEFYTRFAFPIQEGIIIPTAWHVAVALQRTVQNNFMGKTDSNEPWARLPDAVASIAATGFNVRPGVFDGDKSIIHSFDHVSKSETSQIAILGNGDPDFARCEMETHLRIVSHEDHGDELLVHMAQMPPETEELFDQWVNASRRKVTYNRMTSLQSDLVLATQVSGAVVTFSKTNHDIMSAITSDGPPENRAAKAATAIATMELPLIEGVSVNQIVLARRDTEALQNFRAGFRKACAAVKAEAGTDNFKAEVDAIARDTVQQGIKELQQAYKALRKKSVLDLSFSTALVALSVAGVGLGQLQWLPATLGGIAQLKSILDTIPKQDELRKNPYFILWSMSRKPFSSGPG